MLRKDAELLAWILTHPETAAEELEDAAAGEGTARSNVEKRRAAIAAARRIYEDFDRDSRFVIDWKTAGYSVKLRDPIDSRLLYTILVVTKQGTVYVGWLDGQLGRAGLSLDMGRDFVRNAGILLGRTVNKKYFDAWDRPALLSVVGDHLTELTAQIQQFAEQIYAQRTAGATKGGGS